MDAARRLLAECLAELHLDVTVEEKEGAYPSPTIMVNGVDVMGAPASRAAACRLDVPAKRRLLAALRNSLMESGTNRVAHAQQRQIGAIGTAARVILGSPSSRMGLSVARFPRSTASFEPASTRYQWPSSGLPFQPLCSQPSGCALALPQAAIE